MSSFTCQRCGAIIRHRADEFELRGEIISANRRERLAVRKLVTLCRGCAEKEGEELTPYQGVPPLPTDTKDERQAKREAFDRWRDYLTGKANGGGSGNPPPLPTTTVNDTG